MNKNYKIERFYMKKKAIISSLFILLIVNIFAFSSEKLLTIPEKTNFTRTSTYAEVMDFIKKLKERHPKRMKIDFFATSTEGKKIPIIILSEEGISKPQDLRATGKFPVLIMANIHAGEVEGKEATQILIREILEEGMNELLKNQVILIIPIFNPDGNDKMAKGHRGDNGPEKAGVRHNGQGYDLNRDYIKLETPEVKALVSNVFVKWDPVIFVDMHTTDGSYHREPVTYAPNMAPEGDPVLIDYMWKKMLPAVDDTLLKKYGIKSIPYGNFVDRKDPSKGWRNHAYLGRYGTCYYGLRNRLSILDENYSHADFKTRVLGALGFLKSILKYTNEKMNEIVQLEREADIRAMQKIKNSDFPVRFESKKTYDFTIESYVFKVRKLKKEELKKYPPWFRGYIVEKTDKFKNYRLPLFASFKPTKFVKLTEGYILLPSEKSIAELLKIHGINVELIEEAFETRVKVFKITGINPSRRIFQGHHLNRLEGVEEERIVKIPKGSFYVSLSQPLSRLAAYMLEPLSLDGLAAWNFFDRIIVREWSNKYRDYPIYKALSVPKVYMHKF